MTETATEKMVAPVIIVKNLKHAEFASEETHCFEATVYVDGKRFCKSRNEGHGGCNDDYPIDGMKLGELSDKIKELNVRIAATADPPPDSAPDWRKKFWEEGHRPDFEQRVSEAVTNALITRDLKRSLKKKVMYSKGDGAIYEIPFGNHTLEQIVKHVGEKYPGARILNTIPFEDALKIYLEWAESA